MNDADKTPSPRDMDTVRFISLISMFASSAYQSMGKIANPITGKVERNLDGAQGMIDILVTLQKKTRGNLTKDEERMLTSTISDLQMNFVKEKERPSPVPEKKEGAEEAEEKAEEEASEEAEEDQEGTAETPETAAETEEKESGPVITPPPPEEGKEEEEKNK